MKPRSYRLLSVAVFVLFSFFGNAQTTDTSAVSQSDRRQQRREAVRTHWHTHYKPYGFVRNYLSFDSRECVAGTGDLYLYLPKDNLWSTTPDFAQANGIERHDLNAQPSLRFLSLTTRLGLDIGNYRVGNTQFEGKIEADFYAGLTGTTGVALFRLRRAYLTLCWDSLALGADHYARVSLLMGQDWHPMADGLADVLALNSGAPFGPFSRTPQVRLTARLGDVFSLTAAALWQMQYTSTGPQGSRADYINKALTPEAYLGFDIQHSSGLLLRAGVDLLSIRPRTTGVLTVGTQEVAVPVSDRLTTYSPFVYLQYKHGDFTLKAKTIFAQAGEHFNLNGGYGVSRQLADGSREYTPTRNSTSFVSISYGGKIKGTIFAGYVRNFGTIKPLVSTDTDHFYFFKNGASNMVRLYRVAPSLLWTIGHFQLGAEYTICSAQYGDDLSDYGLAQNNLHWVTDHRVEILTKFNF